MKSRIIYEDDHIIVAYKPAGLATQTAKVGQPDMVSELKKERIIRERAVKTQGGKPAVRIQQAYLGIIHRLDQPVEGLLVFAKNQKAAAQLTKQLSGGSLNKQYFAVICGQPLQKAAEFVDYLLKGADNRAQVVTGQEKNYPDAKKAVLQYKLLESVSTPSAFSLVDIHIDTGRFHQIRAQMAHAGFPLLGDVKYGTEVTCEAGRKLGIRSVALCAYKLVFQHPVTGRKMSFEIKPENKAFDFFLENNFGCDCLY